MNRPAPKKSLGQNFLVDKNISAKIVREFAPEPGQIVVEIGPGQGALTELLAASGCRLVAVELDPRMAELIRERHGTQVEVIEQDVLKTDLGEIAGRYGDDSLRVIGNIPYYITSPILFHLIDQRRRIADAMLMMQREVAERLVAKPRTKEYGVLAVMTQTYTVPKLLFNVGPKCFFPPPQVTSSIVRLTFREIEGLAGIETDHRNIVRTVFNQRRKTLRNALAPLVPNEEERARIFERAGIGPQQRAEELTPADFVRLARAFHASAGADTGQTA